jgi:hypothetical protein
MLVPLPRNGSNTISPASMAFEVKIVCGERRDVTEPRVVQQHGAKNKSLRVQVGWQACASIHRRNC